MSAYDVLVIGGGANGLTAAALAARAGRRSLLLERRQWVGGLAAGYEFHPGYRSQGLLHDTGQVRPWVVKELGLEGHGLTWGVSSPVLVPRRNGESLEIGDRVKGVAESDAERYAELGAFLSRLAPVLRRLLDTPPPDLFETGLSDLLRLGRSALALRLLGRDRMMEVLRVAPTPVADWLDEWFESEALKAGLAAPALWAGRVGPRAPGTTANLLLGAAAAGRPVAGGPRALIEALEAAARAGGAEIRTGADVEALLVRNGRVCGVRLADGEEVGGAAVAASCDPRQLFLRLVPPAVLPQRLARDVSNFRARGTTAKVELALDGYPELRAAGGARPSALRIGETLDELERASDAVKYRRLSPRPILEIRVPTVEDPSLAPEGHHVFSVLVHFAPRRLEGGWSDGARERLYRSTLDVLEDHAPGIGDRVVGHEITTPADLEERFGLSGGHVLHGEHALDQLLVRPTPQCARYATPIPGLFLCGSGSHPGGGVSCAPGALGARALLAAFRDAPREPVAPD